VRVRDEIFGNLYLTEKECEAEFNDDDMVVLEALDLRGGGSPRATPERRTRLGRVA
jgi:hypothetical protein